MTTSSDQGTLLAVADFRRAWSIGAITGVSRWLEFVAVSIFTYEITGSPELVALLGVLRMLPYVAFGIVMGALADVFDRRAMLAGANVAMAAVAAAMLALAGTDRIGYGAIAAATLCAGVLWTTDMPLRRRFLVDAVGAPRMAQALGLDNATMYATRVLGPLAGGAVYQSVGLVGIYALVAAAYLACALLACRFATPSGADAASGGRFGLASLLPPRALLADRRFQVVLGVTIVYNLWCFPFVSMVPVIAQKDFALTPAWVGALTACDGVGGTLGALLLARVMREGRLFPVHYLGTGAFVLLIVAISLAFTVGATAALLVAMGAAAAGFSITQYALVYTAAPPDMRGRATGVLSLCIGTSMLGHYHTGLLFERLGSVPAMRIMAAEAAAAMIVLGLLWLRAGRAA